MRWTDVVTRIELDIAGGRWAPGTVLPERQVLAREWGVHEATVAKAVSHLVAQGRLERVVGPGRPVRVPPPFQPAASTRQFPGGVDWAAPRLETVSVTVVDAPPGPVATAFGRTPLLRWRQRWWDGDHCVALWTLWGPPDRTLWAWARAARAADWGPALAAERAVAADREWVTARLADPAERRQLGEDAGTPVVVLAMRRRRDTAEGRAVEWADGVLRAARFNLGYRRTPPAPG